MITAKTILELLACRHSKDIFVPECKNGPSVSVSRGQMVRMDAWTMPRSWTKPATTAYEIKVDRQDFLRDKKWPRYLDYCHQFYFACAPGVVTDPAEIPEQAGYVVTSRNGRRLYTKKKAPHRDVEIPDTLYMYLLICRSLIETQETRKAANREQEIAFWREWLQEKEDLQDVGWRVSKKLRQVIEKEVYKKEADNKQLQSEIGKLQDVQKFLDGMEISVHAYDVQRQIKKRLAAELPAALENQLRSAHTSLGRLLKQIDERQKAEKKSG